MLHPTIIEVSPEGKILYQMKEKLARTIVGGKVVREMLNLGVEKEADFCNIVWEELYIYIADDKPGIPSAAQCDKRLSLIKWLATAKWLFGGRIKGLSYILWRATAKLYMYALAKSGTYCVQWTPYASSPSLDPCKKWTYGGKEFDLQRALKNTFWISLLSPLWKWKIVGKNINQTKFEMKVLKMYHK